MDKMLNRLSVALNFLRPRFRIIVDRERQLGNFDRHAIGYEASLNKDELSRKYVLGMDGSDLRFLDVGARDGDLTYLLGMKGNLHFDSEMYARNKALFRSKFDYYGMDLKPGSGSNVLHGDICNPAYLDENRSYEGFFDVVYSNNVFEHLRQPFSAANNICRLLKVGGTVITVVPFSQRYHESPGDYFRYTHEGVSALFHEAGDFEVLESGYDILGRRNNWQGSGDHNDIVPVDKFGAWRETWFTVHIARKFG